MPEPHSEYVSDAQRREAIRYARDYERPGVDWQHVSDVVKVARTLISVEEQLETLENACEQALMLLSRKRFDDDPEAKVMRAVLSTALGDSNPAKEPEAE